MSEQTPDLVARLDKLERENRKLKRWGGVLAAGAIAAGLMSMVNPTASPSAAMSSNAVCDTVWAERFVMQDSRGKKRMMLDAYSNGTPTVAFYDKAGKSLAQLAVASDGQATLDMFMSGKKHTAYMRLSEEGAPYWAAAQSASKTSCTTAKKSSCSKDGEIN